MQSAVVQLGTECFTSSIKKSLRITEDDVRIDGKYFMKNFQLSFGFLRQGKGN